MSESRNDVFKDSVLFHGSPTAFNPGDLIEPRGIFAHAYATTNPKVARSYGRSKAETNEEKDSSSVYHVEPVENDETLQRIGDNALSKKGFKVVRKVRVD
jgi:hypothetical protein